MSMSREVVIVDDDVSTLNALAELVSFLGAKPTPFACSRRARDYVVRAPDRVVMVVTDLDMPELDGEALARELRDAADALPVLLVSGAATTRLDQLRASGLFVDVIGKSAAGAQVVSALRKTLAHALADPQP